MSETKTHSLPPSRFFLLWASGSLSTLRVTEGKSLNPPGEWGVAEPQGELPYLHSSRQLITREGREPEAAPDCEALTGRRGTEPCNMKGAWGGAARAVNQINIS